MISWIQKHGKFLYNGETLFPEIKNKKNWREFRFIIPLKNRQSSALLQIM